MPCAPQYGWYGVNNGAMMWRVDRIRAHLAEYWEEIMRIVNEKAYRSPRFAEFHATLTDNIMKHPGALSFAAYRDGRTGVGRVGVTTLPLACTQMVRNAALLAGY